MLTKEEFVNKVVDYLRKGREDIISESRVRDCMKRNNDWVDDNYNRYANDKNVELHEKYWVSSLASMVDMDM